MATRTARSVARPSSSPSNLSPPAVALPRLRLAFAKTGDYPLIHGLLVSVFHGPSPAEFQAQLDEPGYEPSNRLIVKDGDQIAAHLRLARQTIHVAAAKLSAARFMDLATAPEYRSRGLATALLAAGERAAGERGVLVGVTRTRVPALFARHGWTVCGRHEFSSASPRAVLAELSAASETTVGEDSSIAFLRPLAERIIVRPLRRIELRAIARLYDQHAPDQSGWPVRSEAYWEWLLSRGGCDRVYIAAKDSDASDFAKLLESIVGYACVRQSRIAELVTAKSREDVARHLVERICADAREQDEWAVRYDAPPSDSLHELFRRSGGRLTINQEVGGELFMAKLLDPLAALRSLADVLARRAAALDLTRPVELGIELRSTGNRKADGADGILERFRMHLAPQKVRIETGGPSRHCIALAYSDLAPLLLGDMGARTMIECRRMKASTERASRAAVDLFPGGAWWRPPLDDLLA
jgi:predicted acetyltransferase